MSFGEVKLIPGVNVERTPTLNEAGISSSQLIRFKDALTQKYGGFQKFYPFAVSGIPRDLHAWQDLNGDDHLAFGSTTQLGVITAGSLADITPQTKSTSFTPNFSTSPGTTTVGVNDSNLGATVTTYDAVYFQTPVAVDGIVLSGLYPIDLATGTTTFNIHAATAAISTATATGTVPTFTTTAGAATVAVRLDNHGLSAGGTVDFPLPTTFGNLTIDGVYTVNSVTNATTFVITVGLQVATSTTFAMNNGSASLLYYINLGPPSAGAGYGLGAYGAGGYGTGVSVAVQTGTPITATDWSSDNWGQILLACPENGGVYQYDPLGGFQNAGLVASAPPFNGGIFVSTQQQMLFAWGTTVTLDIGIQQDPMLIRWSDILDYTQFTPLTTNQAGSYRLSNGSMIKGGMSAFNQNLFWTDLDLWVANYQGQPFIWGFNIIGSGAGLISSHAAQRLRSGIYWMGPTNFYVFDSGGVKVLPCPVWDAVFQNLSTATRSDGRPATDSIRAMPNTPFNEAGWEYPSAASVNGENDSYVKFNITEPNQPWDIGPLARSAWIDQTVLGMPIGAAPSGIIYQHETTNDADGQPMSVSFTTGYFYFAEGEDFVFVDQIIPDFKWGFYGAAQTAQVQISVNVINFPGDTPTVHGPYTITQVTKYISTRIRGRQGSFTIASSDLGSWWRIGKVRYRWAPDGRN